MKPKILSRRLCPPLALALLTLLLGACLENEEAIVVGSDGSIVVTVGAKGDPDDLTDGYAVPLGARWRPVSADAERWLAEVGTDTGGELTRVGLEGVEWDPEASEEDESKAELFVQGRFDSVEEWPRWFAPESDPYRTAYLERSATLSVQELEDRTVYVFERVYHGRNTHRVDFFAQLEAGLTEELLERIGEGEPLTDEEWQRVAHVVKRANQDSGEIFAREALAGAFTENEPGFDPSSLIRPSALPFILGEVREAAGTVMALEDVQRVHALIALDESGTDAEIEGLMNDMERRHRQAIRQALRSALEEEKVDITARNAVLYGLEWGFTFYDHLTDLADETYEVTIEMPGVVLDGNFRNARDNRASWEFEGQALRQGPVNMRVTSVVEK